LREIVVGDKALRRPWQNDWQSQLVGQSIRAVNRRGKWIIIELAKPRLVVHLGMTGQLTVASAEQPFDHHTHLIFRFGKRDKELRFRDIRRFGSATFYPDQNALDQFFEESGLGPEPFNIDPDYWRECFTKTNRCLKAILLDQRVLAGVGNIYADEALFEARLAPSLIGKSISAAQADRLRRAVATILERAIERRGSSIRNYVGGSGLKGSYQESFRAYGRTGQPCRHCKTSIERIVLAGRSTHFCPTCQRK